MDYVHPDVLCPKKTDKLTHSLTHLQLGICMGQFDIRFIWYDTLHVTVSMLPKYSWIPLSPALLSRGNQLVTLTPRTSIFSDPPLATAHVTDPVTHMCWREQISPLVTSSLVT